MGRKDSCKGGLEAANISVTFIWSVLVSSFGGIKTIIFSSGKSQGILNTDVRGSRALADMVTY